jgi:hypothetical protein
VATTGERRPPAGSCGERGAQPSGRPAAQGTADLHHVAAFTHVRVQQRLEVVEEGTELVLPQLQTRICAPYTIDDCVCENETTLLRLRRVLAAALDSAAGQASDKTPPA